MISTIANAWATYKFLRLLTTPWDKTPAFRLGVIDASGNKIVDELTPEQKKAYTQFDRLIFNIKRLLNKIPLGKTKIASFATALYLIREHYGDDIADDIAIMIEEAPITTTGAIALWNPPVMRKKKKRIFKRKIVQENPSI